MENLEVVKYVSADKYAKVSGIGVAEVKKMCTTGKIPGAFITDGGHYKIPIQNANTVTREEYDKLLKENEKYKEKLNIINQASSL